MLIKRSGVYFLFLVRISGRVVLFLVLELMVLGVWREGMYLK